MGDVVLVAYATRRGSTREVADAIGARLSELGLRVEVRPADRVGDAHRYAAIVLGGALYMGRLHPDARAFLHRHRKLLARVPVAVFAMGPRTVEEKDVASSRWQLDKALRRVPDVQPFAIAVFGGVVDPAKLSFPFRRMAASDARDWDAIDAWARELAPVLAPVAVRAAPWVRKSRKRGGGIPAVRLRAGADGARRVPPETAGKGRTARPQRKETEMRKAFELGGFVAAAILIAFGVVAIVLGVNGRSTVQDSLKLEKIVASPDMTAKAIAAEAKDAGLPATLKLPTANIAGKEIVNGQLARDFASYMRIHTLEATGGLTYAEMGRFATADGQAAGTNAPAKALKDAKGQPVSNGARDIWVTETALTTALNTSYMAEQVALFGLVVGVALLLSGIGFAVLAVGGTLRNADPALNLFGRKPKVAGSTPVPTA